MKNVLKTMQAYVDQAPPQPHDYKDQYITGYRDATETWLEELKESDYKCSEETAKEIVIMIEHQMDRGNWSIQSPFDVMQKMIDMIQAGLYKGKKK